VHGIMSRKRKQVSYKDEDDSEESEWEAEEEQHSEDEAEEQDNTVVEDDSPPSKKRAAKPKKPAVVKSAATKKRAAVKNPAKKKSKYDDAMISSEEDEGDHLSSVARRTTKGGYAHTNKSRILISKANRGNVPWNKGKNRSESEKSKIAAGVRARNREVLLKTLDRLNMTEDEWHQKKKEIKFLRERVRRAKKASNEKAAELKAGKAIAVIDAPNYAYASDDEKKVSTCAPVHTQVPRAFYLYFFEAQV
jgi:hypothetical protein